jgi:hypothetical protein
VNKTCNEVKRPLNAYSKNQYSQNGEDGIIEEILSRVSARVDLDGWCMEFGAWDGIYLSNTCQLIRDKNYKAVLIEGDAKRYRELCANLPQERVFKICKFVTLEGDSTLENILKATPIPFDFDFLSIDIDGCDYYIFESLQEFKPKVVCIEFNPSIPNEVDFIQPRDFSIKQGTSAKALVSLATRRGYVLAAVTHSNLIFVREGLKDAVLGAESPSLESLRDDSEQRLFLFVGYDGTILSNKRSLRLPWHGVDLRITSLQVVPRIFRRYSGDYNFVRKISFIAWRAVKSPVQAATLVARKVRKALAPVRR